MKRFDIGDIVKFIGTRCVPTDRSKYGMIGHVSSIYYDNDMYNDGHTVGVIFPDAWGNTTVRYKPQDLELIFTK